MVAPLFIDIKCKSLLLTDVCVCMFIVDFFVLGTLDNGKLLIIKFWNSEAARQNDINDISLFEKSANCLTVLVYITVDVLTWIKY